MKDRIVLILVIFLCVTTILFGIFSSTNHGKPNPEKITDNNNLLYYFGDNSTAWLYNGTEMYGDRLLILQNVSSESQTDIAPYCYPYGPFFGVGYSGKEIVVLVYKDRRVTEAQIRSVYSVVERHGEEHGIKKIPCKFLAIGMVKTSDRKMVPGLPRNLLPGWGL